MHTLTRVLLGVGEDTVGGVARGTLSSGPIRAKKHFSSTTTATTSPKHKSPTDPMWVQCLRLVGVQQRRGISPQSTGVSSKLLGDHCEVAGMALNELLRVKPQGYVAYMDVLMDIVGMQEGKEEKPSTSPDSPAATATTTRSQSDSILGPNSTDFEMLQSRLHHTPNILQSIIEIRKFTAATATGSTTPRRVPISIELLYHLYSLYQISKRKLVTRARSVPRNPFEDRHASPPSYTASIQIFVALLDSIIVPYPTNIRDATDLRVVVRDAVSDSVRCSVAGRKLLQDHANHKDCDPSRCPSIHDYRMSIKLEIRKKIQQILPLGSKKDFERTSSVHLEIVELKNRAQRQSRGEHTRMAVQKKATELLKEINKKTSGGRSNGGGVEANGLHTSHWGDALQLIALMGAANAAKIPGTIHNETRSSLRTATSLRVSPMSSRQAECILGASSELIQRGKRRDGRRKQVQHKVVSSIGETLQFMNLAQQSIQPSPTGSHFTQRPSSPNWAFAIALLSHVFMFDVAAPLLPHYHEAVSHLPSLQEEGDAFERMVPEGLVCYLNTLNKYRSVVEGIHGDEDDEGLLLAISAMLTTPPTASFPPTQWCPLALSELLLLWWDRVRYREEAPSQHVCQGLREVIRGLLSHAAPMAMIATALADESIGGDEGTRRRYHSERPIHATMTAPLSVLLKRSYALIAIWAINNWDHLGVMTDGEEDMAAHELGLRWLISPLPFQRREYTLQSRDAGFHIEEVRYFDRFAPPTIFSDVLNQHDADPTGEKQRENQQSVMSRESTPSILLQSRDAIVGLLSCRQHLPHQMRCHIHDCLLSDVSCASSTDLPFIECLLRSFAVSAEEINTIDDAREASFAEVDGSQGGRGQDTFPSSEEDRGMYHTAWSELLPKREVDGVFLFNLFDSCARWLSSGRSLRCSACARKGDAFCKHTLQVIRDVCDERKTPLISRK